MLFHGSIPPSFRGGPKNFRPKKLGGGDLSKKLNLGGAKLNGGPKILGGDETQ